MQRFDTLEQFERWIEERWHGYPASLPPEAFLGLAITEEAGEIAGKVKKLYRDHAGLMDTQQRLALIKEAGDLFHYLTRFCNDILGVPMLRIAEINAEKLEDRDRRGTFHGEGDNR